MKTYTGPRITLQPDMNFRVLKAAILMNRHMDAERCAALYNDIRTVLMEYSGGDRASQQAADRHFRDTYKRLFKQSSYTFENASQRALMMALRDAFIPHQAAPEMPSVSGPSAASAVAVPIPGFKAMATSEAFQRVLEVHLGHFQNAQDTSTMPMPSTSAQPPIVPMETPAHSSSAAATAPRRSRKENFLQALEYSKPAFSIKHFTNSSLPFSALLKSLKTGNVSSHMPATQAFDEVTPEVPSAAEVQHRRATAAISQAVADMAVGNAKFREWLDENNIEAVPNSGNGLNCLIIALLQHATGAYDKTFEPELAKRAAQLRTNLGIDPGMLYSDNATAARIVKSINNEYGTNIVPVEVQATKEGLPFIAMPLETIPEGNRVMIWQRGNHFEALYARDSGSAS